MSSKTRRIRRKRRRSKDAQRELEIIQFERNYDLLNRWNIYDFEFAEKLRLEALSRAAKRNPRSYIA